MLATMPFGRHRGTAVADLPRSYLKWLLTGCDNLQPVLERAVRDALAQHGERYVPAVEVLSDLEEELNIAISSDDGIPFDLAGRITDHWMIVVELVKERHAIGDQTELMVPARRGGGFLVSREEL